MKNNLIIGIVVIIILLLSFNLYTEGRSSRFNQEQIKEPAIIALISHEPIVITHDDNFTHYGFPGNGTAEDPYIIENYNITTSNDKSISITDTTKFFVIRNCYVDAYEAGITISNVAEESTAIMNNICNNNDYYGIFVYYSSGVTITNNMCKDNNEYGIGLHVSTEVTVTNNICSDNYKGIFIDYSSGVTITNNMCSNNKYSGKYQLYSSGIHLAGSTGVTVTNNTCNNNDYGISLDSSSTNNLTQNTCKNNDGGIYLFNSGYCLLTYNLLQENAEYGISVESDSDKNIIHHNTFKDNRWIDKTSQAFDEGANNIWYDSKSEEGNYWSDWDSKKPYHIRGEAQSEDPYPLNENLERIIYEFVMFVPSIVFLVILHKLNRNKKAKC